tara:strand:+ start:496 stop:777 length:282 start_codon:yes stop_codon:yes gene_type:complete
MFTEILKSVGMKLIGKGLKDGITSAFGGEDKGQRQQPVMPNFSNTNMGLYSPSPTGQAKQIETSNYDMTLAMWEKRLFGKDSYTNITIPPLGN